MTNPAEAPLAERRPAGRTPELGEYIEYGETLRHSLLVMGIWLAAGAAFLAWSTNPHFSTDCYRGLCGAQQAEQERGSVVSGAVISFVAAAIFALRRLFRRPGLRLGELGFEIRTQVLSRHKFVGWPDVRVLYPSRRRYVFWRRMDVGLVHSAVAQASQTFVTVRLSGLSAVPSEIEAEMADRVQKAHPKRHHMPDGRAVANGDRVLHGISADTGGSEPDNLVTSASLLWLLEGIGPDSPFVVLTAPSLRDEQHYIQATMSGGGGWHVEYRDGGPDSHFGADCDDLETVHEVMVEWADDSGEWRTRLPWYQMSPL